MAVTEAPPGSAATEGVEHWVPSRFTARTEGNDGELILYNSYTGAIGVVPAHDAASAVTLLRRAGFEGPLPDGLARDFADGGFLIPAGVDEFQRAAELRKNDIEQSGMLQLIIMPSETCNFRCVYCYESFQRGRMQPGVRDGIKAYVAKRAAELECLSIQWFGGEPTTAPDVIDELSRHFRALEDEHEFAYESGITTNGFNLTQDLVDMLLGHRIDRFQVTIDGPAHYHNERRKLLGGGGSFERIIENLRAMHERPESEDFSVALRVNFDRNSIDHVPELIAFFGREFEGDRRFLTYFRPIGQWGGPNDASLPVCYGTDGETAMWELHGEAIRQGVPLALIHRGLRPGGMVCYAAQPFSIIIGVDGRIYKCTVALDDERNVVGRLHRDGTLEIEDAKFRMWVEADERADPKCQPCFFRPACQGARCPWIRIRDGRTPCPPEKLHIKRVLKLIADAPTVDDDERVYADMD